MKHVLLIGTHSDPHIEAVSAAIRDAGAKAHVIGVDERVAWEPGLGWLVGRALRPTEASMWWRRQPGWTVSDPEEAALVADEWHAALRALSIEVRTVIDPPDLADRAGLKLLQLATARDLGIRTPGSVFTDDPEFASDVAKDWADGIVAKPISSGPGLAPYAALVGMEQLPLLTSCPTLLQEHIVATADIRVVVVDDDAFIWRRPKPIDEPPDWRRWDPAGGGFQPHVETEVAERACAITRALQLRFSVQDWLEAAQGPYFLEVNARGSWSFLADSQRVVPRSLALALLKE